MVGTPLSDKPIGSFLSYAQARDDAQQRSLWDLSFLDHPLPMPYVSMCWSIHVYIVFCFCIYLYIYIFCSTHTHLPLENLRVFSGCCWKRLQCADFLDQILCPPVMAKNKNQAFEPNKLCRLTRTKIHDYSGPNDQSCKFQWNGQGGLYMNINYIYIYTLYIIIWCIY